MIQERNIYTWERQIKQTGMYALRRGAHTHTHAHTPPSHPRTQREGVGEEKGGGGRRRREKKEGGGGETKGGHTRKRIGVLKGR